VVDLSRDALTTACLEPPGAVRRAAEALGADPLAWVLTGGEDHALVAAFPADVPLPAGWTAVGRVRAARGRPGVLVDGAAGETVAAALGAAATGHAHFT
jgi:thiamine-monophosphate kinase